MAQKPAKFLLYARHQIRVNRSGEFSVDGLGGKFDTLIAAKGAIDTVTKEELDVAALYEHGSTSNGKVKDLEEVRYLGKDPEYGNRHNLRIKGRDGIRHAWATSVYPDTPEVRAAWKEYQRLTLESHKLDEKAERIKDGIKNIVTADDE